ncbi:MAG: hypothetical protein PHF12_07125 [Candidatus Omnitrophica bacterium]|nr:hypothetical protein [Candidatus Omnitrophota bacterium]
MQPRYEKAIPLPYEKREKPKVKICYKCKQAKILESFPYQVKSRGYRASICRECGKEVSRQYAATHREESNKHKREWIKKNPEKAKESARRYAEKHPEKVSERSKRYRQRHPESVSAYNKKYRAENPDFIRELKREWVAKNIDSVNVQRQKRLRERFLNEPEYEKRYRLRLNMSNSINISLDGKKNGRSWEKLVGYTLEDLIRHLEKHFLPGMTWENRGKGGWHVDHKIPISVFNITSPDDIDFKKCWALKNLRPLWEADNLKKKDRIERPFQPSLAMATG